MIRHLYLAGYAGDPTQGFDFQPIFPFDKVELVQPDSTPLYPEPPRNSVLVSVECQKHTELSEAVIEDVANSALRDLAVAALEAEMWDAVAEMSASYSYVAEAVY